jgi:cytochrome c oxidase assembly protein subunit 15
VISTARAIGVEQHDRTGSPPVSASVASWLGVLFVMLIVLNTVGGWVRLSGAGVAIPQWPIINGSLLPPLSDEGWEQVKAHYDADQLRLAERVRAGELTQTNLGHQPKDLGEFKSMFMTEWSHRLFAALVGIMTAGCLTVIWRRPAIRHLVAGPMTIAAVLIIAQAVLGGMLVRSGTNTHWLFLHQANASLILACVLISILRILADGRPQPTPVQRTQRRGLTILLAVATCVVWMQLVLGSLVAGSRSGEPFQEYGMLTAVTLWNELESVWWNFQSNPQFHQWSHRWLAWTIVVVIIALIALARYQRPHLPQRLRLGLQLVGAFLLAQVVLGIGNVWTGITANVSLAHQFMGMCLFLSLVLCWFDARREVLGPKTQMPKGALS